MLDQLLNFVVRVTNLRPKYTSEHCLAVTKTVGGCQICAETCPHDAITIKREVEIDEIDCTGCGLCVHACPSQALVSSVTLQPGGAIKCSKVKGNAQNTQCLGRLRPYDLLRLSGRRGHAILVHNDCESCLVGSAAVLDNLQEVITEASSVAALLNKPFSTTLTQSETYNATDNPDKISRRELLRGGFRGAQAELVDLVTPLEHFAKSDADIKDLPTEHVRKFQLLELADLAPDDEVAWPLPRVAEGCIVCPVCTNICPTDAFSREFALPSQGDSSKLILDPERCNGCAACVTSCPIKVIDMEENVTWGEVTGGAQTVYHKEDAYRPPSFSERVSRSPKS